MEDQILDSSFSQQEGSGTGHLVYSTFWTRLAAILLDALIAGVIGVCLSFVALMNTDMYYIITPLQIAFALFYHIYLVQAKGATPGKMVLNLKIIKTDGTAVDYQAALLRYLPSLLFTLASGLITLLAIASIDQDVYEDLTWMQKMMHLGTLNPQATKMAQYVYWAWLLIDIIVFFTNKERRALHDKIADTVVIGTK